MKIDTKRLGQQGEDSAVNHLVKKNYRIVERNVRLTMGEIDIVAVDPTGAYLVFVEVKSGKEDDDFPAWIHFDQKKRKKYVALAQTYLARKPDAKKDIRFDLITVFLDTQKIEHFEDVLG